VAVGVHSGSTGEALRTTDGGTRWSAVDLPAGTGVLNAVACPSASVCEAVGLGLGPGAGGVAVRTTDGGATWSASELPAGTGALQAVACPSVTACEVLGVNTSALAGVALRATDGVALRTTDGGTKWAAQKLPVGSDDLEALACPSRSVCEALGLTLTDAVVLRLG
jgi:photosystem II stability/assembly factor-like uncharacterized protein